MKITLAAEGWRLKGGEALVQWLISEQRHEGYSGEISLVFVDDGETTRLNEEFLEHRGPTDVIAFDFGDSHDLMENAFPGDIETDADDFPGGEVYVSLDRAEAQAKQYGVTLSEEIARLSLHGLLHLAGWSDAGRREADRMREREDEGLARAAVEKGEFPWSLDRALVNEGTK